MDPTEFSQQKAEEARRVEAEAAAEKYYQQQQAAAGTSYQYQPAPVMVQPQATMMALQPLIPPNLWPHNFLIFSIVLAAILGVMNPLTLPLTVTAAVLAFVGHLRSKRGEYTRAKTFSKVTLAVLLSALGLFTTGWFSGWMPSMFVIGYIASRNYD